MKRAFTILTVLCWFGLCAGRLFAAESGQPLQMTVYLRDGSRVVAESLGDNFHFHSPILGDLTLAVSDIRSVECASNNTAKVQLTNGDVLNVSFLGSSLAVNTRSGSAELPIGLIREIIMGRVQGIMGLAQGSARAHPSGLASLWSGEGDALDSAGTNDGKLEGHVCFITGQVGEAFSFTNAGDHVRIPASRTLDVAADGSFSITAWVFPTEVTGGHSLLEWNKGNDTTYWGVHFCLDAISFDSGPGTLYANIVDVGGAWHQIHSPPGVVTTNGFQFVALTYDKSSGLARLYCNSYVVAEQTLGSFNPDTRDDLFLGHRPMTKGETCTYLGALDEVAIYSRALSQKEIEEQCRADHGGELPPAPDIPGGIPAPAVPLPTIAPHANFNGMGSPVR